MVQSSELTIVDQHSKGALQRGFAETGGPSPAVSVQGRCLTGGGGAGCLGNRDRGLYGCSAFPGVAHVDGGGVGGVGGVGIGGGGLPYTCYSSSTFSTTSSSS